MIAATTAFRKEIFASNSDIGATAGRTFGLRSHRQLRYDVSWALYENTAYDSASGSQSASSNAVRIDGVHAWSKAFKEQYGLYKYTRGILNPIYRLVEFHVTHLMGGELDPHAGDGSVVPTAMPIIGASDALRLAASRLLADSNWQTKKDVWTRFGASQGDVFLSAVDGGGGPGGRVYLEVVPASLIADLHKDAFGNIKSYVREEYRDDPTYDRRSVSLRNQGVPCRQVVYTETADRDGNDVVYRTFKDYEPYAWNGEASEWTVPYGFIPLWHTQHMDVGKDWGWSEFHATVVKILEQDDSASKLNDQIRKTIEPIWMFSGISQVALKAAMASATGQSNAPQPDRNATLSICSEDPDAKATALVADLDISGASEHQKWIVEQFLQDYPELRYEMIRATGDANAKALQEARKPAEAKIRQRRAAYDAAITKAIQGAIAIAGWRNQVAATPELAPFAPFNLESFARGDLDFRIGTRPVFEGSPVDQAEEDTAIAAQAKAWTDIGVPLSIALARCGWSDEDIAKVEAYKLSEDSAAAERMARLAERVPGSPFSP